MDKEKLLSLAQDALARIEHPRFFKTERGYQGRLLSVLEQSMPEFLTRDALLEQEHQKTRAYHGLTLRPDIIVHEPFDPARHESRRDGNIAVIELKLRATREDAVSDFDSLLKMMDVLRYPFGIFINIDSQETYVESVPEAGRGRIVCFATSLRAGRPHVVREQA